MGESEDIKGLATDLQIALHVGRVTGASAALEQALAGLVAALSLPATPDRSDAYSPVYLERRKSVVRKPFEAKMELLRLLWPVSWRDLRPFADELTSISYARNDLAHSYGGWELTGWRPAEEPDHWYPEGSWGMFNIRTTKLTPFDSKRLEALHDAIIPAVAAVINLQILANSSRESEADPLAVLTWHRQNPDGFVSPGLRRLRD